MQVEPASNLTFFGIAVSVSDIGNAVSWYEEILGFKLALKTNFDAIRAKGAFLQGHGIRLELLQTEGAYRIEEMFAMPPAHLLPIGNKSLILYADDLSSLSDHLHEKKVNILWERRIINEEGMLNTMITDMDGNFISIFERKR